LARLKLFVNAKTASEKTTLFITRRALESALESSRATFPNEFIGLFRGTEKEKNGVKTARLTELIIAPLSEYGEGFSSFSDIFIPMHTGAIASFHSHPHAPAAPSRGDLHFFSRKGRYHFIACPPFDWRVKDSVRVFDSRGKELEFKVV
jgi:proteasome lid subunit RPN8/RPN11